MKKITTGLIAATAGSIAGVGAVALASLIDEHIHPKFDEPDDITKDAESIRGEDDTDLEHDNSF